mmetsp:Transcript_11463/g.70437  ORF Transcript_11463/g.70437 Transcript_11463/m.70437 type:complete len:261 (+) Transcript_11463:511-1293(+)
MQKVEDAPHASRTCRSTCGTASSGMSTGWLARVVRRMETKARLLHLHDRPLASIRLCETGACLRIAVLLDRSTCFASTLQPSDPRPSTVAPRLFVFEHVRVFPSRRFPRPRLDPCDVTRRTYATRPSCPTCVARFEPSRSASRATRASAARKAGGARSVRPSRGSKGSKTLRLARGRRRDARTSTRAIRKRNVRPTWCNFALPHVSTSSEPLGVAMLHVGVARVRRRAMSVVCRRKSRHVHGVHGGRFDEHQVARRQREP